MSTPSDTAEFLEELNGGAFASQIGHALSEVASGVVDHGKAGKLVITLDFSQIGESSQVKIKHKLDYKVPTKRGTASSATRNVAKRNSRRCRSESGPASRWLSSTANGISSMKTVCATTSSTAMSIWPTCSSAFAMPNMPREIDPSDVFCDDLPEEGEIRDQQSVAAFELLNEVIRQSEPLSWSEGKFAAALPQSFIDGVVAAREAA